MGLICLAARSRNTELSQSSEFNNRIQSLLIPIANLETSLKQLAGIRGDRIDVLRTDESFSSNLATVLRSVADGIEVQSLATLRAAIIVDRKAILRRYLDVVWSRPAITPQETPILYLALLSIPEGGSLIRENHGFGYHFHYSDDGKRRADILLTFSREPKQSQKPVTWEPHAVRKSDFQARVDNWGNHKRNSVHDTCMSDLTKRKMTDYVLPGKTASLLL